MALTKEIITAVKERADIVEIIGERVQLNPSGSDFLGLCPFHNEKSPSFRVNPSWRTFHCFGCGKGGSVIDFLMENENLGFVEVVQSLAERYGIELPKGGAATPGLGREGEVLTLGRSYYHALLMERPEGEAARLYLKERGFSEEDWERFGLGFALDAWQEFTNLASAREFSVEDQVASGLVRQGNTGRAYDMLRKRIVFPIHNELGRPIGFGGRVIDPLDQPKYLNTAETRLYKKNKVLFGLHEGRETLRREKRAIIVEGYLDVIRLHQQGFTGAVATCGTALGTDHVSLLERMVEQVVLLFDGDEAGLKASLRSAPLFLNRGLEARVVLLPGGQDPDDFLRQHGSDAMREQLERAEPILEFLVQQLAIRNGQSVLGKERTLGELAPLLSKIQKATARDLTIRHLSDLVGVSPDAVFSILTRESNREAAQAAQTVTAALPGRQGRHQRRLLRMLLTNRTLVDHARTLLRPDDLDDRRMSSLLERIFAFGDDEYAQMTPEDLMDWYPDISPLIRELLLDEGRHNHAIGDPRRQLENEIIHIKELMKARLFRRFKELSGSEEETPALQAYMKISRELKTLRQGFRQTFSPRPELRVRKGGTPGAPVEGTAHGTANSTLSGVVPGSVNGPGPAK